MLLICEQVVAFGSYGMRFLVLQGWQEISPYSSTYSHSTSKSTCAQMPQELSGNGCGVRSWSALARLLHLRTESSCVLPAGRRTLNAPWEARSISSRRNFPCAPGVAKGTLSAFRTPCVQQREVLGLRRDIGRKICARRCLCRQERLYSHFQVSLKAFNPSS